MKTILFALGVLASTSAFADPVRLGALLTFETHMDGKSGMGAEKCVPVTFELQEDGLFAAHLQWTRDLGLGEQTVSFNLRQELVDSKIQYFYSTGFRYGGEATSGGEYISSPLELSGKHLVGPTRSVSGRGGFTMGVQIESMDSQWCKVGGSAG